MQPPKFLNVLDWFKPPEGFEINEGDVIDLTFNGVESRYRVTTVEPGAVYVRLFYKGEEICQT